MIDKETIDALGRVSLDLSKHLERMIEPYRGIEKKVESLERVNSHLLVDSKDWIFWSNLIDKYLINVYLEQLKVRK